MTVYRDPPSVPEQLDTPVVHRKYYCIECDYEFDRCAPWWAHFRVQLLKSVLWMLLLIFAIITGWMQPWR